MRIPSRLKHKPATKIAMCKSSFRLAACSACHY